MQDFRKGDFADPFVMAAIRERFEISVAFNVLLHQPTRLSALHLMLEKTERAICIVQPMLKERDLSNSQVFLPGNPHVDQLAPALNGDRADVQACSVEEVNHGHWIWGMTQSFLGNALAGEGFEVTREESGESLPNANWFWYGCIAERRAPNPPTGAGCRRSPNSSTWAGDQDSTPGLALIERQDTVERLPVGSLAGRALEAEQLTRYRWAAQAVSGKDVLDAGCGAGLGTRILAQAGARRVTGLDASEKTVAEAVRRVGDVAELVAGDLETLPFAPAAFDVAVCFDVVERVEQREQLLDELERVLGEDGILLISLPGGVEGELTSRFPAVSLHRQHSRLASAIAADGGLPQADSARVVAPPDAAHVPATLAVAGKRETPDLRDLVVLAEALEVQRWEDEVTRARRQTDEAVRQVEAARGREEQAASERQLVARRLIEAEQLTAQAQVRVGSLEEEIGRRREEIVSRDAAVAALRQTASRGMASLRRGAKALLGARR